MTEIDQNTEKSPGGPEETCYHSDSCERASGNTGVKNSQGLNNNDNDNNTRPYNQTL